MAVPRHRETPSRCSAVSGRTSSSRSYAPGTPTDDCGQIESRPIEANDPRRSPLSRSLRDLGLRVTGSQGEVVAEDEPLGQVVTELAALVLL